MTRQAFRGFVRALMTAIAATMVVTLLTSAAHAQSATPAYIGSQACADCHREETDAWEGSHHDLAWTPPDAQHIVGDFDDAEFEHKGVLTRFTTENGVFFIQSDGPDGAIRKYPVAGVAGIAPLQQYLIETEPGRLQSFDVVWDIEKKQWYHLYPDQNLPAGDGLHWTGPYKNWNARCAECHATGFSKNYDPITKQYTSTQSEIGVGCEACHGPGEAHRDWATASNTYDPDRWNAVSDVGFFMDFKSGAEAEIQQCASCHARREPFEGGNPLPGTGFHDAYRLALLRAGSYHADGQILDEVYVYGSFLQSRMYANGVACTDCHNPHTAELVADGNAVCTQCHARSGNSRFPSLKKAEYDSPSHYFHPEGSEGAQCKSCHMIERDYMGIDGRRDHSFRVPRPDLTVLTGSPNACNDCHVDNSAAEMAAHLDEKFPDSAHRGQHFAQLFALPLPDDMAWAELVIEIAEHQGLPGIVRATALELLSRSTMPLVADRTQALLADPDPLVRAAAIPVQRRVQNTDRAVRLVAMLADAVRSVRMAAAREFLSMKIARMPAKASADLAGAMAEWQLSLRAKADFPETQVILAGIGLTTRNMEVALSAFSEAVEMDPQLTQAWTMIIRIHAALGNRQAAVATAEAAMAANPNDVALHLLRRDLQE